VIDTPKIQQVLINLIINAMQAMDHDGTLTITTAGGRLGRLLPPHFQSACPLQPDDPVVILKLKDTGPGIPKDQLQRIFDPFFTTKAVGAGTGLGLSVVKKIIDLHNAFIHFRNSPHGGLEVTLAFAAIPQPTTPASPGPVLVAK
jgi:signal transduction histidine kinase